MNQLALLFPGQGSQYIGMGKKLTETYIAAQDTFHQAAEVLGFDLLKLCEVGPLEELTKTENAQPAILTATYAAYQVYRKEVGFVPQLSAGHSLGEISALVCAGAIQFADAVKIVRQRGLLMQNAVPLGLGAMSAVSGISLGVIEEICAEVSKEESQVWVSNYNAADQIVVSGHSDAVRAAGEKLEAAGARVVPLKVSGPFHTPLMQPAAEEFGEFLKTFTFHEFQFPVVSNVTGLPYQSKEEILVTLPKQLVSPVQWISTMDYMKVNQIQEFVEIGPQKVLTNLSKRFSTGAKAFSFDTEEDREAFYKQHDIKAVPDKEALSQLIYRCLAMAVSTKNYNFDNTEYQNGVVVPYRKIKLLAEELESKQKMPTLEEAQNALALLATIFKTKQTPVEERLERKEQILSETNTKAYFETFEMIV